MFISKSEKADIHHQIKNLNKVVMHLALRLDKLEQALAKHVVQPTSEASNDSPVIRNDPQSYHELFKTKRRYTPPNTGMTNYVRPYLENMSKYERVEVLVPEQFDAKSLRCAVSSYMYRSYGFRSYCTKINDDRTIILVERLL